MSPAKPRTSARQRPQLPESPAEFALAIYRAATDDAAAVAERLTLASRAAAVGRFEQMWPSVPDRPIPTRRVLRDWYLHVYQKQLDRGLNAPADSPIDGNRAEEVFTMVREKSGAPTDVVIDTVLSLARDARQFASSVSTAQDAFVTAALAGRVATVFPRRPGVPVSARQAIGEQWYIRSFHAELDPAAFHMATRSLGPAEVAQVVDDLRAGAQRLPGRADASKARPSTADRRRHAALAWNTLPDHRRLRWLTDHHFKPRLLSRAWTELPTKVQDQLLTEISDLDQTGPTAAPAPAVLAGAIEAAAARFGEIAIRPASQTETEAARALFHRGGAGVPPQLIGEQPVTIVVETLNRLKAASPRPAQTRGLPRQGWWTETEALDRAVRMRVNGANWKEIGQALGGVSGESVRSGVERYGDVDPALTRTTPHRLWTQEELATVAELRAAGRRYCDIAVLIGRSSGKAVSQAVLAAVHRNAVSPDDFTLRTKSGGENPPSPGL